MKLLDVLKREKDAKQRGGIYHKLQIELTYNSNHMEGSCLSIEQTRLIFETNTIGAGDKDVRVDDVIETNNHFRCVDFVIEHAQEILSEELIKRLHFMLKSSTSEKSWRIPGEYKLKPNEVGGRATAPPKDVPQKMKELLTKYNGISKKNIRDIISFHHDFEAIHPFADGNGRVGRLIMLKECLANDIIPFIIDEFHRSFYYRGLKEWGSEPNFLLDTCMSAQDVFKEFLRYFEIEN